MASEQVESELKKLLAIATDLELGVELRMVAVKHIAKIGTQEALNALLSLAANDKITAKEREMVLKLSQAIVKSGR